MKYLALKLNDDKTACAAMIELENETEFNRLLAYGWKEIDYDLYKKISVDANTLSSDHPITVEGLQAENKLLKAQLQAQSDRADFIEDCIAEMAMQVYKE